MLLCTIGVNSLREVAKLQRRDDIGAYPGLVARGVQHRFWQSPVFEVHCFAHEPVEDSPDDPEIHIVYAPALREGFIIFNCDEKSGWSTGDSASAIFELFYREPAV
jgi:hypothetical protein